MRIMVFANSSWNIINFRLSLMIALRALGHEVIAAAPEDEFSPKIAAEDFKWIPINNLARKGTNILQDLSLIKEFRSHLKTHKIDLVLSFTIKPNIYGSLARIGLPTKIICTITGLGYSFLNRSLASSLSHQLYRVAFRYAHLVLFQNKDDQATFLNRGLINGEKTAIINGSGVDTTFFSPDNAKNEEHSPLRFLFIGRLLYDKGVKELMAAIRYFKAENYPIVFKMIGPLDQGNPSAISKEALDQFLEECPEVDYLAYSHNIREEIAACSVIVLPSYREGLPRVLLEGLAMGKPLIATDVPGCRETIIHKKNGFLVKAKDIKSLQEAILKMLELSSVERQQMGQFSRSLALEKFDIKIIIQAYLDWIKRII